MFLNKVNYIKHWQDPKIDIKPYSNIFSYKVTAYKYENEVRIILDTSSQNKNQSLKDEGVSLKIRINRLLRSIVVAPEAPNWFYSRIEDIVSKYNVNTPVKRSKLSKEPL